MTQSENNFEKYSFRDNQFFLSVLFISMFSYSLVFFQSPFEFYFHYVFIIILFPFLALKYSFPKFIFPVFGSLLIVGLYHIINGNNNLFTFFKIYGGLLTIVLFYFFLIQHVEFDIKYLFYWYCKFCYLLCLIGLLQIFSFFGGFKFGYDFSWLFNKWGLVYGGLIGIRINSIISEPTYLATIISPAVYISVKNLISKSNFIFNKFQSIIVISILIFTTSSVGYLGMLISIILTTNTFKFRYIIIGFVISIIVFNISYSYVNDFRVRVDAAYGLWLDNNFAIENTNNSSFVLYNNLHIAWQNLRIHPIFGTGLGSHEIAFKKYSLTNSLINYKFDFNIKDGNSLFVRLCSETGLLGLIFIFFLIYQGFVFKDKYLNEDSFYNHNISQALFILIILVLIRQGNYMLNGLPFIFLIYHFNKISYDEKMNSLNE